MNRQLVVFDVSGTLMDGYDNGSLYPHAYETLAHLSQQGHFVALATNLGRGSLNRFIETHGLSGLLDAHVCADDAAFKPAPEMLHLILKQTQVPPGQAWMVGDSSSDMQMARAAGIKACGACWGDVAPEKLKTAGAHKVAVSFQELEQIIGISH